MAAVAAGVMWVMDERAGEDAARADALQAEIAQLRQERDRMQAVAGELVREVHDAGLEAEVVRWQLAYTEERLRRAEDAVPGAPPPAPPPPAGPVIGLGAAIDGPAAPEHPTDPAAAPPRSPPPGAFQLEELEPRLSPPRGVSYSQLDRDRAYGVWAGILQDILQAECGDRVQSSAHRCARALRRTLLPFGAAAVECILSGNARPDYVVGLDPRHAPTHAVPLNRGALLLCDAALPDLLHPADDLQLPGQLPPFGG
jgi:hypothetical protein